MAERGLKGGTRGCEDVGWARVIVAKKVEKIVMVLV